MFKLCYNRAYILLLQLAVGLHTEIPIFFGFLKICQNKIQIVVCFHHML